LPGQLLGQHVANAVFAALMVMFFGAILLNRKNTVAREKHMGRWHRRL
jgi:hypothetical protein